MHVFPLVLSSPSGGGKTTVKNELIKNSIFEFSITCTTREKRSGEVNGVDYYFISDSEFDEKIKNGEFLEWAWVHGKRYGTLKKTVEDILKRKKIPIMTIDVVGAMNVRKLYSNSLLVFIMPPDLNTMIERLKKRGEGDEEIKRRLNSAVNEIDYAHHFDYIVVNDKIDRTIEDIMYAVKAHSNRSFFYGEFLRNVKKTLLDHVKTGG